jgi:glutathione peroxidase-family protein
MIGWFGSSIGRRTLMSTFHDIRMESIDGEPVELSKFQNNLCLIVNVASR